MRVCLCLLLFVLWCFGDFGCPLDNDPTATSEQFATRGFELEAGPESLWPALGCLKEALTHPPALEGDPLARVHMSLAVLYYNSMQLSEVITHVQQAINARGGVAHLRDFVYMSVTLHKLGRPAEAIPLYEQVLAGNPHELSMMGNYAVALVDVKMYEKAFEVYSHLRSLEPHNPLYARSLLFLLQDAPHVGTLSLASELAAFVIAAESSDTDDLLPTAVVYSAMSNVFEHYGDTTHALRAAKAATRVAPFDGASALCLGDLYRKLEIPNLAEHHLRRASVLPYSEGPAEAALGRLYARYSLVQPAVEAFNRSLAHRPHIADTYVEMARLLSSSNPALAGAYEQSAEILRADGKARPRLTPPPDHHEPGWQAGAQQRVFTVLQRWADLHNKIVDPTDTSVPKRYLGCSLYFGLGNRMQHVLGCAAVALVTGRALVLLQRDIGGEAVRTGMDALFNSPLARATVTEHDFPPDQVQWFSAEGQVFYSPELQHALSCQDLNEVLTRPFVGMHGSHLPLLLYNNPVHGAFMWETFGRNVLGHLSNFLLNPSEAMERQALDVVERHFKGYHVIGVQIRMGSYDWDMYFERNATLVYHKFVDCLHWVSTPDSSRTKVFLATDNTEIVALFQRDFGDRLIVQTDVDRSADNSHLHVAFLDQLLLSYCDDIINTRQSSFGHYPAYKAYIRPAMLFMTAPHCVRQSTSENLIFFNQGVSLNFPLTRELFTEWASKCAKRSDRKSLMLGLFHEKLVDDAHV